LPVGHEHIKTKRDVDSLREIIDKSVNFAIDIYALRAKEKPH
jgi:hypothetical protein